MPLIVYLSAIILVGIAGAVILWKYLSEAGLVRLPVLTSGPDPEPVGSPHSWAFLGPVLSVLVFSRLLVFLAGYLAGFLFQTGNAWYIPTLADLWNRWDAHSYLDIAREGYVNQGDPQNYIVFLPLYPLLVWAFHFLTQDLFTASLVVSNLAFLAGGYFLYRILAQDYGSETAFRGVCFYAFTPFGFFLGLGFTEGLFLAVTLGGYWAARRGRWWLVGLGLFLAALTKVQGILLLVPVFMEYLLVKNRRLRDLPAFLAGFLGLAVYLAVNQVVFGDPWHFLVVQRTHWFQTFGFFAENLKNQLTDLAERGAEMGILLWVPQVAGFFLTVVLLLGAQVRARASASAYLLVYLVVSYSATWLLSGNRYMAAAFPVAIVLALVTRNRTLFFLGAVLSAGLMVFFTLGFVKGLSIM